MRYWDGSEWLMFFLIVGFIALLILIGIDSSKQAEEWNNANPGKTYYDADCWDLVDQNGTGIVDMELETNNSGSANKATTEYKIYYCKEGKYNREQVSKEVYDYYAVDFYGMERKE